MITDPKWRVISRKSGASVSEVISVAIGLMTSASENEGGRGVYTVEPEDIAACLDLDEEVVDAILAAMQGRLIEGGKIINWDKRQPKREDTSTERTRAWRERKKKACDAPVTQCDAPEVEVDTETDIISLKKFDQPTGALYRPNGKYATLSEWMKASDMDELPNDWLTSARALSPSLGLTPTDIPRQAERFVRFYREGKGKAYTSDNWPGRFWDWLKEGKKAA